ncbi:MAG TPA: secondary thiamine-phosphate synthase enzyme YjbQ [Candidatus Brocadiales bacterium]|nr:secondary thiamine-phosphate synthase enzyme YjbQ [Candidatus Brocadiales bacterium]
MPIISVTKTINTKGNSDCRNITKEVQDTVKNSGVSRGIATVFIPGATAGVTTIEFEDGVVSDLSSAMNRLIPEDIEYQHNKRCNDSNGHSHIRASFVGPSLTVPFINKQLQLGTWQQIVLIDFDTRPRNREYLINIMGE